jgi:hypothetical protein
MLQDTGNLFPEYRFLPIVAMRILHKMKRRVKEEENNEGGYESREKEWEGRIQAGP